MKKKKQKKQRQRQLSTHSTFILNYLRGNAALDWRIRGMPRRGHVAPSRLGSVCKFALKLQTRRVCTTKYNWSLKKTLSLLARLTLPTGYALVRLTLSCLVCHSLFEFRQPSQRSMTLEQAKKFVANIWPSTTRSQVLSDRLTSPLPTNPLLSSPPTTTLACRPALWHVCVIRFSLAEFHSNAFIYLTGEIKQLAGQICAPSMQAHTHTSVCVCQRVCAQLQNINIKIAFIERRANRKFNFALQNEPSESHTINLPFIL